MKFFEELEQNNHRDWFQPRMEVYLRAVKAPMEELVAAINSELAGFAPDYVSEPSRAIYRIYRDTRFSADKTPYKTHIAAHFSRRGRDRHSSGGFYFSVSHKEIEVAAGVYMPDAAFLLAIRNRIAAHPEEFRRLATAPSLEKVLGQLQGERLTRPPKGFPSSHPAIDLIQHKQWYFYVLLEASWATSGKLLPEVVKRFRAAADFVQFLDEAGVRKRAFRAEEFFP